MRLCLSLERNLLRKILRKLVSILGRSSIPFLKAFMLNRPNWLLPIHILKREMRGT